MWHYCNKVHPNSIMVYSSSCTWHLFSRDALILLVVMTSSQINTLTHTHTHIYIHIYIYIYIQWYISAAEQEMQSVHFDSEADCRHTFFSSWVRICLTSGFNLSNVEFLNVLSTWLNYRYHYRYYYHNHYHNLTFPTMYSNHRPSAIRSSAHITTKMMNRKITSKPKRKK